MGVAIVALLLGAAAQLAAALSSDELEACVVQFPACVQGFGGAGGGEEALARDLLHAWLVGLSAEGLETDGALRAAVLSHLLALSRASEEMPALALGVGQALHSFFWWGPAAGPAASPVGGPDASVAAVALELHERALTYATCDAPEPPEAEPPAPGCAWRWQFVLLLGVELGRALAGARSPRSATTALDRVHAHLRGVHRLPSSGVLGPAGPLGISQNQNFFPGARHWPLWGRDVWPEFAHFLEDNFDTFRDGLDSLLDAGSADDMFYKASLRQTGLAPHFSDWSRLKLVHSGGASELCNLPFLQASCKLLLSRVEIDSQHCTSTSLIGASLARLQAGAELKPHFGIHPRLTASLGLVTPPGASLTVAGREVAWQEGRVLLFDDTYTHSARHSGAQARYVLVAWFCHPCDLAWRGSLPSEWRAAHPLPSWCGEERGDEGLEEEAEGEW